MVLYNGQVNAWKVEEIQSVIELSSRKSTYFSADPKYKVILNKVYMLIRISGITITTRKGLEGSKRESEEQTWIVYI
jgi:hypothetical protein